MGVHSLPSSVIVKRWATLSPGHGAEAKRSAATIHVSPFAGSSIVTPKSDDGAVWLKRHRERHPRYVTELDPLAPATNGPCPARLPPACRCSVCVSLSPRISSRY